MLDYIRKHSQSVLVWVLVAAIAFIFVVQFGPQSAGCQGGNLKTDWVAKVYGATISPDAWRWSYVMQGGGQMQPKEAKAMRLRETVMDSLVERELLAQQAEGMGMRVTDDQVEDSLLENRLFITISVHSTKMGPSSGTIPLGFTKEDGSFDFETFNMFVTNRFHMTFAAFKKQQEREMLAQQMRHLIEATIRVSEGEVRAEYEAQTNRAKVGYVTFDPGFYIRRLDPVEEEVEAWTDEHLDDVKKKYEDEDYKYKDIERQVRTSHILIDVAADDDEDERKALAEKVAKRAKAGEEFAALAEEFSTDRESAKVGGDLGFKSRGQLVEEFEDVAFGMQPGDIEGPVKSMFGYHIIRCEGFREGDIPFDDVKYEIGRGLMLLETARAEAEAAAGDLLERVEAGVDMEEAANALDLVYYPPIVEEEGDEAPLGPADEEPRDPMMPRYKESGWIQSGADTIPGIGKDSALVADVFAADEESPLVDRVVHIGDRWYVVMLTEKVQPTDDDFATKKSDIRRWLEGEKKIALFTQWIDDLRSKAEQEGALQINESYLKYDIGETEEATEGEEERAD